MSRAALALAFLLAAAAAPLAAQRVGTAVAPDTLTVGDVFHAAVRVELPPGYRAAFPDSLDVRGDVENAARREVVEDTAGGRHVVTAIYPLTTWRPGAVGLPGVPVRIVGPDVDTTITAAFDSLRVASVLPPDTAGIQPKPAKGVVGGFGFPWLWLLLALLAVGLLAALAYWLMRRRRRAPAAPVLTPLTARQRALARLERLREERLFEREGAGALYTAAAGVLRRYLHELHPPFGAEYTTREIGALMRRSVGAGEAAELVRLLEAADLVKFARRAPTAAEAYAELDAMKAWVHAYPPAPLPETERAA